VIAGSLPPLIEMHVSYYDDGLEWIINDDYYIDVDFLYSCACLLECSRFRLQIFIHVSLIWQKY
jgi:hypothetical protein